MTTVILRNVSVKIQELQMMIYSQTYNHSGINKMDLMIHKVYLTL